MDWGQRGDGEGAVSVREVSRTGEVTVGRRYRETWTREGGQGNRRSDTGPP